MVRKALSSSKRGMPHSQEKPDYSKAIVHDETRYMHIQHLQSKINAKLEAMGIEVEYRGPKEDKKWICNDNASLISILAR